MWSASFRRKAAMSLVKLGEHGLPVNLVHGPCRNAERRGLSTVPDLNRAPPAS
jgi:hypothetical protein